MFEVHGLSGIAEVMAGDDIGTLIADALAAKPPQVGDVLVVTQKIVSKAERRMVALSHVAPGDRAIELAAAVGKDARLIELVLTESTAIVRQAPNVLITRHRLGLVMANSGIDQSNLGAGHEDDALLLPLDPDASARTIADAVEQRYGTRPAVVISDSFGRPWRHGVVNVAIGCAGLPALEDKRGQVDRDGRVLQATLIAYGDLIASAAGLAMGEAGEGVPVALVRGLRLPAGDVPAAALVRAAAEDLFR